SDTICIENGLSIVENPKPHGKSYNKWLGEQAKPSHREQLRVKIDRALEQKPADFDTLLQLLSEMGCEVSRRGKAIRLKAPGWKNVARMDDKLGADRKSTRLNSSHVSISYAVFCLKKKKEKNGYNVEGWWDNLVRTPMSDGNKAVVIETT